MSIIRASEARLATLAVQETRRKEHRLVMLDEAIKGEIRKGRMKLQVAEIPQWMYDELKLAGYSIHHLLDGYEIRWEDTGGAEDGLIRP